MVDQILAVAVPEPSSVIALLRIALAALFAPFHAPYIDPGKAKVIPGT